MLPNILMNLDFAASAVDDAPANPATGLFGQLLLIGVGRIIIPFFWIYPILRIF